MKTSISRRKFMHNVGKVTLGTAALSLTSSKELPVHAGENNTIKIALVGCGGRGSGAILQALSTAGPTKLVALADIFKERLNNTLQGVVQHFKENSDKIDCPQERHFIGFDAYKKAIDAVGPGGVVLLATPPVFRPLHVEYAANAGVHIFMEKSFAVDVPGLKRLQAANEIAKKNNLKVASGLYSRHFFKYRECIQRIHDGAIGDVMAIYSYRVHGAVGCSPKRENESELSYQLRNYSNFTWVNGSFYLDWLIHNLDVSNWIKNDHPVSVQGQGGRQVRTDHDQMYDHYAIEYTFSDGKKCIGQARHQNNTWGFFGIQVHGTKGSAVVGEGVTDPKLFSDWNMTPERQIWQFTGKSNNGYQTEHDVLFNAIRNDLPHNETEMSVNATLSGIMGRMAAFTGQKITWDNVWKSTATLAPNIDAMTWDTPAYAQPDKNGNYPIAQPGNTTEI